MADIHLRALANTTEQLRCGNGRATLDALTEHGAKALTALLPSYCWSKGPIAMLSVDAARCAETLRSNGLVITCN
jgi:hypothetical protein